MRDASDTVWPIAVNMTRTKRKRVVNEGGIDHIVLLGAVEEIGEIAQVTVAAANTVTRAVLVQDKHLTRTEPSLLENKLISSIIHIYVGHSLILPSMQTDHLIGSRASNFEVA